MFLVSLDTLLPWKSAERFCRVRGLQLADFENSAKIKLIASFLASQERSVSGLALALWSSGYSWSEDGSFTLNPTRYFNPGEENNATCSTVAQWSGESGERRSASCRTALPFLCAVPEACYESECFMDQVPLPDPKCAHVDKCPTVPDCKKTVKSPPSKLAMDGFYVKGCNNSLFFISTSDNKTHPESMRFCCKLGLTPVVINDYSKLQCLGDLLQGVTGNEVPTNDTRILFWTGGWGYLPCEGPRYLWCPSGVPLSPRAPWMPAEPAGLAEIKPGVLTEQCVVAYSSRRALGLAAWKCGTPQMVICEGAANSSAIAAGAEVVQSSTQVERVMSQLATRRPTAETLEYVQLMIMVVKKLGVTCKDEVCQTDRKKFDKDGNILIPPSFGEMVKACGRKYLLSNAKLRATDKWKACCDIGLYVTMFESWEEINCLNEAYKEHFKKPQIYLVSAFDEKSNRSFTYCGTFPGPISQNHWLPGEPNNLGGSENCAAVLLSPGNMVGMMDVPCTVRYSFICEDPVQQKRKRFIYSYPLKPLNQDE